MSGLMLGLFSYLLPLMSGLMLGLMLGLFSYRFPLMSGLMLGLFSYRFPLMSGLMSGLMLGLPFPLLAVILAWQVILPSVLPNSDWGPLALESVFRQPVISLSADRFSPRYGTTSSPDAFKDMSASAPASSASSFACECEGAAAGL